MFIKFATLIIIALVVIKQNGGKMIKNKVELTKFAKTRNILFQILHIV